MIYVSLPKTYQPHNLQLLQQLGSLRNPPIQWRPWDCGLTVVGPKHTDAIAATDYNTIVICKHNRHKLTHDSACDQSYQYINRLNWISQNMWMKITQNSAPGIGKAPLPGKTKDPQEPAIAQGQLSFVGLIVGWYHDVISCGMYITSNFNPFLHTKYFFWTLLLLFPKGSNMVIIFFPLVFADLVACTAMSDSSVFAAHLWWTCAELVWFWWTSSSRFSIELARDVTKKVVWKRHEETLDRNLAPYSPTFFPTFGPSTPLSSLSWPEHCTRAPKSNHVQNWYLNW